MQEATPTVQEVVAAAPAAGPVAGAIITALGTVAASGITAFVTALIAIRSMNKTSEVSLRNIESSNIREMIKLSVDVTTRQLNELYGPMLLLVRQIEVIATQLRENIRDKDNWNVLDHVNEILNDPKKKALFDEIMAVEQKMEEVITSKGGYCEDHELQRLFAEFLAYYRILRVASQGGASVPQSLRRDYPLEMNTKIIELFERKMLEIDRLRASGERLMKASGAKQVNG